MAFVRPNYLLCELAGIRVFEVNRCLSTGKLIHCVICNNNFKTKYNVCSLFVDQAEK